MNLNNGKKLEQIQNEKTKIIIENLRQDIVNFSTNNPIKSNHPEIEKLMNQIVEIMHEANRPIV